MNLKLSSHAIARYHERVRPTVEREQAEHELRALLELAGEPGPAPDDYDLTEPNDAALEVSDGVLLLFRYDNPARSALIATTVAVRGCGYFARQRRAEKRKRKRARGKMRSSTSHRTRGRVTDPEGYGGYGW